MKVDKCFIPIAGHKLLFTIILCNLADLLDTIGSVIIWNNLVDHAFQPICNISLHSTILLSDFGTGFFYFLLDIDLGLFCFPVFTRLILFRYFVLKFSILWYCICIADFGNRFLFHTMNIYLSNEISDFLG